MNRVVLSREEGQWFARNVLKTKTILEAASKKDPQTLERTTYKTLASIEPQAVKMQAALDAFGDDQYELEVMLERKQKLIVKDMLSATIKQLEEVVIPEYSRRAMEDRVTDINDRIELLKSMRRKFK